MFKIKLLMPFWTDGKTKDRERNVFFCWEQLKKINNYLNNNNILSDCILYDFSPTQIHPEAKHFAHEIVYERSKKINLVIEDNDDSEYFMFFDSDVFFIEDDFSKILDLIKNISEYTVYTFDMAKLNELNSNQYVSDQNIDIKQFDWWFAFSGEKNKGPLYHHMGGLGATFIVNRDIINRSGRFDENFKTWGGEDGDAISRVIATHNNIQVVPIRHFYPFHLYHFIDWSNPSYR